MTLITVSNGKGDLISGPAVIDVNTYSAPKQWTLSPRYMRLANLVWIVMAFTLVTVGSVHTGTYYYGNEGAIISIINGTLILVVYIAGLFSVKHNLNQFIMVAFVLLIPLQIAVIIITFADPRNDLVVTLAIVNTVALVLQVIMSRSLTGSLLSSTQCRFLLTSAKESLNRPFGVHTHE